jgi:molybdopterin synthase sulfur carrier subunit
MIKILYFASLREKLGCGSEEFELAAGVVDIGGLLTALAQRDGEWASLAAVKNLKCAVNQEMARNATPVKDGDEVAFFPPVTGG